MPETALTLLFGERFGAVDRILSLLRRRGFPIRGVTIERTERAGVGRMTVVVQSPDAVEQVARHLEKLPDVLAVTVPHPERAVQREYLLARVRCGDQQNELRQRLHGFEARVVSASGDHLVVEASGPGAALDALCAALAPFGIEEFARTSPLVVQSVPQEQMA